MSNKLTKQSPILHTPQSGHRGNLTEAQEAKLRALWAIGFKFIEICEADKTTSKGKTLEEKYVPPAKKKGNLPRDKTKISHTHQKYPNLINEMLSLLPTQERNMQKLAKQTVESLDNWTPDMYHLLIQHVVKHEHPDELALRYLRAANWDLIKATTMMGKSIYWRTMEAAVEDDIVKNGEGGAAEDEKNGQGFSRTLAADFMRQCRLGKSFIHGTDRAGRPICYVRVKTHRASDQCPQSIERYTIYLLELARLSLRYPVEMGTILLDLSGFTLANFDLQPLKFIFRTIAAHYPDSVGLILVHKAPFGAEALWKFIRYYFDSRFTSRVKFTTGRKSLSKWIAPNQMIKELGGDEDWEYKYLEPLPDENIAMLDTDTRDDLLEARQELVTQFEDLTKEWVMTAQLSEKAGEVSARRDNLVQQLTANYWALDPYIRCRSLYERQGHFLGPAGVQWYKPTKDPFEDEWLMHKIKTVDSSVAAVSHDEHAVQSDGEASVYSYDTD